MAPAATMSSSSFFLSERDGIACRKRDVSLVGRGWNGLSERDGTACQNKMESLVGNETLVGNDSNYFASSIVTHSSIAALFQKRSL